MATDAPIRVLVLGAHPDDAEFACGGLAALHAAAGSVVKFTSVTNGAMGHQRLSGPELTAIRRREAAAAAAVIGAESDVWEFEDAHLTPTLDVRMRIIREIRSFQPDLVLTHRPCDYHPDHRAVGLAVQDASYLVTLPQLARDVPHLDRDPIVAYLPDAFTKPTPIEPHVVLDVSDRIDEVIAMLSAHESQVFDWLPFNQGVLGQVPAAEKARKEWLREHFLGLRRVFVERFQPQLAAKYGPGRAAAARLVEVYEISEYARKPGADELARLFPE